MRSLHLQRPPASQRGQWVSASGVQGPPHPLLVLQRTAGNAAVVGALQRDKAPARAVVSPGEVTFQSVSAANPAIIAALPGDKIKLWHDVIAGWAANRRVDDSLAKHEKQWRTGARAETTGYIADSEWRAEQARIGGRHTFVDELASRAALDPARILSGDIMAPQPWNVDAEHRYRQWAVEFFASKPLLAELTRRPEMASALEESQNPGISSGMPHVNLLWGGGRIRHTKGVVSWEDLQQISGFRDQYRAMVTDSPSVQAMRQGIKELDSHITQIKIEHLGRSDTNRAEGRGWFKRKVTGAVRHVSEEIGTPGAIELQIARLRVQANPNDRAAQLNLAETEGRTQDYPRFYDTPQEQGIWHEPDLELEAAKRFQREGKFELALEAMRRCEHSTTMATAKVAGYESRVQKGAGTAVTWLERAKKLGKFASAFTGTGGVLRAAIGAAGYTFAQEGSEQVVANWMDESNKIDLKGLVEQSAIEGLATLFGGATQGAFVDALEARLAARLIPKYGESLTKSALSAAGATTAAFYNAPAKIVFDRIIAGKEAPRSLSEVCGMVTDEVFTAPGMDLVGQYVHSTRKPAGAAATHPDAPRRTPGAKEIAAPRDVVEGLVGPHQDAAAGRHEPTGVGEAGPRTKGASAAHLDARARAASPEVLTIGPSADGNHILRETAAGDVVICQRCTRLQEAFAPELRGDATLRDRVEAVRSIPEGPNRIQAERALEAEFEGSRRARLGSLTVEQLKRQIGDPKSPVGADAMGALVHKYEELPIRRLVELQRRNSTIDGPAAADVLERRKGKLGTKQEYEKVKGLDALRQMARHDPAALDVLIARYEAMTPEQLRNLAEPQQSPAKPGEPLRPAKAPDELAAHMEGSPVKGPAMETEAEARLVEAIWQRRAEALREAEAGVAAAARKGGVRAANQAAAAHEAARMEGTLAAMETGIKGIEQQKVFGSPQAPQAHDPAPKDARTYKPPPSAEGKPPLPDSAHHHGEDRLLNWLDDKIVELKIPDSELEGKIVRIAVDQAVCSTCAAGVGGTDPGVILQFSLRRPGLTIEIVDIQTGTFSAFQNGRRTVHIQRGYGTEPAH